MSREVRRVPLDFDFPPGLSWAHDQHLLHEMTCSATPARLRRLLAAAEGPVERLELARAWDLLRMDRERRGGAPLPDWGEHGDEDEHGAPIGCVVPDWEDALPKGDGWQLWQGVSDGPISPVFATSEELVTWMCQPAAGGPRACGQPWDQGWSREAAENLIQRIWAPSLIVRGPMGPPGAP